VTSASRQVSTDCESTHSSTLCNPAPAGHTVEDVRRGLLHPFLEYDEPAAYLNSIVDPMDEHGFVHLSDRPGLGEDINFDYIETHTVSRD